MTPTAIGVLPMIEAASTFGVDVFTYSSDVSTVKAHGARAVEPGKVLGFNSDLHITRNIEKNVNLLSR